MRLVLARHGNTFEPHDKVVWVGARTDLPLTAKGREQASALGEALQPDRARIARIIAGPLKRTREHAEIVSRAFGAEDSVVIDERLREIDYGLWEGKSSAEIQEAYGDAELDAWNKHSIWPESANWSPNPELIRKNVSGLADELATNSSSEEIVLLITSNGILRFLLHLIPGAYEKMAKEGRIKVATGHCCVLRKDDASWDLLSWDRAPAALDLD